jgi:hypothetical protein
MTTRSERRAAELHVIEVARSAVRSWNVAYLADALADLDALGLETPGRARANKGAPVTAKQAAVWMNGEKSKSLCSKIVRLLSQYISGLTTEEIEVLLSGKHQSISPRITDLRDTGWLRDSEFRRKTKSGGDAIVWKLSYAAWEAIRGQEGLPI